MSPIGVLRLEGAPAGQLAAMSRQALDRSLRYDAELVIAQPSDEALVLGALQRFTELGDPLEPEAVLVSRGSCGAEARVGPGTLWVQLALARPSALVACDPSRLLNRYVRPLLRALSRVGALTHYFDRDWLSAAKRPIGMIAFAHDAKTGRALVEAIIAVDTPFAFRARPSYLGKEPATLAELGLRVEIPQLADAVASAYAAAYSRTAVAMEDLPAAPLGSGRDLRLDRPWTATRDEAVGIVAAGVDRHDRMRVGGELMASRDALTRLEERIAGIEPSAIGAAVDETLGAPGVALLGVRSLTSVRDVLVEALGVL